MFSLALAEENIAERSSVTCFRLLPDRSYYERDRGCRRRFRNTEVCRAKNAEPRRSNNTEFPPLKGSFCKEESGNWGEGRAGSEATGALPTARCVPVQGVRWRTPWAQTCSRLLTPAQSIDDSYRQETGKGQYEETTHSPR